MKKIRFFSQCLALSLCFLIYGFSSQSLAAPGQENGADEAWMNMPAGARPAYMGIHGGTMPVSLLVSGDGASLLTFVGRTGNDFLETLREAWLPLPTMGNSTRVPSWRAKSGAPSLFAGNATATMPVLSLPGETLAKEGWLANLQPFGLSPRPLRIEGEVTRPEFVPAAKKYRILFLPDHFQPRR